MVSCFYACVESLISPLLGFTAVYVLVILMLVAGLDAVTSIILAAIVYGLLVLGPIGIVEVTVSTLTKSSSLNTISAFILALFLAGVLREHGVLSRITGLFESLSCLAAALGIPALIGLIPMSGGALVSAMMLKETYFEKMKVSSRTASFLNFWFRHIWVTVWPLYLAFLLTAYAFGLETHRLLSFSYPIFIGSLTGGVITALSILAKEGYKGGGECKGTGGLRGALDLWPFLLLVILVLGLKIKVSLALLATDILVLAVYRPRRSAVVKALKFAFTPRLLASVISGVAFAGYILVSGAGPALYHVFAAHGFTPLSIAFLLPFSVGLISSGEFIYAVIAMPMVAGFVATGSSASPLIVMTAFLGGYLGALLSPFHLCLVFTLEYYGSRYRDVVPLLAQAAVIAGVTALMLRVVLPA